MAPCKCWVTALAGVLLLPNIATSADAAREAYQKGISCLDKRDYDAAITAFTETIRLDPRDAQAYEMRGEAFIEKGDKEQAIADFTEAIRLNPKSAEAYYNRGLAYQRKGEKAKAEEDFAKAKKLDHKAP